MRKHNLVLGCLSLVVLLTIWVGGQWKAIYDQYQISARTSNFNPFVSSHSGVLAEARAEDSRLDGQPTPTPTLTLGTPSREEIERFGQETFGDKWPVFKKIIQCESSFNSQIVSKTGDTGLSQINQVHGIAGKWLKNPKINLLVAKQLFEEQGFRPWRASFNCHKAR